MAVPSTKATLKSYCLRALGYGVIDINISDGTINWPEEPRDESADKSE